MRHSFFIRRGEGGEGGDFLGSDMGVLGKNTKRGPISSKGNWDKVVHLFKENTLIQVFLLGVILHSNILVLNDI